MGSRFYRNGTEVSPLGWAEIKDIKASLRDSEHLLLLPNDLDMPYDTLTFANVDSGYLALCGLDIWEYVP